MPARPPRPLFTFRERREDQAGLDAALLDRQFDRHNYKIVRQVNIRTLDAFGYSITDSMRVPRNILEKSRQHVPHQNHPVAGAAGAAVSGGPRAGAPGPGRIGAPAAPDGRDSGCAGVRERAHHHRRQRGRGRDHEGPVQPQRLVSAARRGRGRHRAARRELPGPGPPVPQPLRVRPHRHRPSGPDLALRGQLPGAVPRLRLRARPATATKPATAKAPSAFSPRLLLH